MKSNGIRSLSFKEYVLHRENIVEELKNIIHSERFEKADKYLSICNLIHDKPWLVDEKLAFYNYISEINTLESEQPIALSDEENTEEAYGSITILELKHPKKNDYIRDNHPIWEMLDYAEKIEENKIKDKCGGLIKVNEYTQFFLYAVCDLTDSLIDITETFDFSKTADKLGMYWYNRNFNAYIQIISYEKLIKDAERRNNTLFEKLEKRRTL